MNLNCMFLVLINMECCICCTLYTNTVNAWDVVVNPSHTCLRSFTLTVEGFEVNIDQKKLKTPSGVVFRVPTESLALMVATEWDSQHDTINRSIMHLVSDILSIPLQHTVVTGQLLLWSVSGGQSVEDCNRHT